ncbi:hypothetical protein B0T11DRAFT_315100 [Plectosphaerella cucumerina]|uniref:Uncharacterized protein n=1 Tax=Plectosphaerella cucumerina TaxID=40658 RepID=A0A8K0XAD3_9PEZI|nr:hypothetical protein B0T11DRAFT_315100 [Plectosphaerella cucumerina]
MQPRLELALPVDPRHLYRHLIREASYLPGICRPFVNTRIRAGFVRSKEAIYQGRRKQPPPTGLDDPQTKAIHHGLRQLRGLRAVNLGDTMRIDRLMHHVFGRSGKRRRELLVPLLRPPTPRDSAELQKHLEQQKAGPPVDSNGKQLPMRRPDGWDKTKVLKHVQSQIKHQSTTSPSVWMRIGNQTPHNPQRELIKLPPVDHFGKPINERRVRKAMERWWKAAATKLAPPVEKSEWERLRAAAAGELPEHDWKFAPRRPIARSLEAPTPAVTSEWDWKPLVDRSASFIGRPVIRQQWRLTGKRETGPFEPHKQKREGLRARALQRTYDRIWNATPYVEEDPETLATKAIHWGSIRGLQTQLPVATAADARIFAGEVVKTTPRLGPKLMRFSNAVPQASIK